MPLLARKSAEPRESPSASPLVTTTSNGARIVNTKLLLENDNVKRLYQEMEDAFKSQQALELSKSLAETLKRCKDQIDILQNSQTVREAQRQAELFHEGMKTSGVVAEIQHLHEQYAELFRQNKSLLDQLKGNLPKHSLTKDQE